MKKVKTKVDLKKQKNVEENIRQYSSMGIEELLLAFNTTENGITSLQIEELKDEYDKNIIVVGRKNTLFRRLIHSLINPFNLILLIIAIITFVLDVLLEDTPDYIPVIIILSLVLISSVVSFIQGEKSNSAREKLTKLISNKADVLRDGKLKEIDMEDILQIGRAHV